VICDACGKPQTLCVCAAIEPIDTRACLLILQHPQERDRDLGTARLAARQFRNARLVVGLSWPNLAPALGRDADPRAWATLYPGQAGAEAPAAPGALEGVIALDGSWSQAKALWWRNPWLLKTQRLVLRPTAPSLYGELRREPRPDALSTLEAAATALAMTENDPRIVERALVPFRALLARYRAAAGPRRGPALAGRRRLR
jgi:DTW domain-containing protein YfiP